MGYTVTHLDEALPAMWNALSDSFNKDVINGDAETRARWGSYALTQIGLGLLGDKGVSKAAKLAQGLNSLKVSQKLDNYLIKAIIWLSQAVMVAICI